MRLILCHCEGICVLSYPQNRENWNAYQVYRDFIENVKQFKELNALPVPVAFGDHATPEMFMENKASWHRSCHQKFDKSKLEGELTKKRKKLDDEKAGPSLVRRTKCQSTEIPRYICIFCETYTNSLLSGLMKTLGQWQRRSRTQTCCQRFYAVI